MGTQSTWVPVSIWQDEEWLNLPQGSQWLWFYRRTHPHPGRFSAAQMSELMLATVPQVEAWADLLRATKYGGVLLGTGRRGGISPKLRAKIYERDGHACLVCGSTDDLTLDHIYPWSLGGSNDEENLRTLCRGCNSRKGSRVEAPA
jgi:hypothetical protein